MNGSRKVENSSGDTIMEIEGKKVKVLGGFGGMGFAICREFLAEKPKGSIHPRVCWVLWLEPSWAGF